jgi:DNA-binding NtrC family response regulator
MKMHEAKGRVRILVAEHAAARRERIAEAIREHGYEVTTAEAGETVRGALKQGIFDVVITAAPSEPDASGVATLHTIRAIQPDAEVIILAAEGSVASGAEALAAGAYQYLTPPFRVEELLVHLGKALAHRNLLLEFQLLRRQCAEQVSPPSLWGESPAMRDVRERMVAAASGRSPVLIRGEAGTGKDLVARSIHALGPRQDQPFAIVDCRLPEAHVEAELFGCTGGELDGSLPNRRGMFEEASGGTVFLDEVVELPRALQAKLLRTLQTHRLRRVGGRESVPVDVRVISSDRGGLATRQRQGKFRADLLDCLSAIEIELPPLRDRSTDIPALAGRLLEELGKESGKSWRLSPQALSMLVACSWPGNVRELASALKYAAMQCPEGEIGPAAFPPDVRADFLPETVFADLSVGLPNLDELGRRYSTHVLKLTRGNKTAAAAILGVARTKLYKLQKPATRPRPTKTRDA